MKLSKALSINNEPVNMVQDVVQLYLHSPGRATFEVITDEEPKGLVSLHIGYQAGNLQPYFLGVIDRKYQHGERWYLTCRELLGALSFEQPFSLRFPALTDVLDVMATTAGSFETPDKDYTKKPVPAFHHSGDGITALRQLGSVFDIPDYIFQQRTSGTFYVGSWHDSHWAQTPVTLPAHLFTSSNAVNASFMAVPKCRPGLLLNNRYVLETILNDNTMTITWSHKLLNA